jgi:hypothetical protein
MLARQELYRLNDSTNPFSYLLAMITVAFSFCYDLNLLYP